MDKANVEKWLNRLAKAVKQFTNIKDFNEDIQICDQCTRGVSGVPYVQLYKGIDIIAEMFDLEVTVAEDEDSIIRHFMWNKVMFLEYSSKGDMI